MHRILHIDTSSSTCTVGLSRDGVLIAFKETAEDRNHAAAVNIMIADVLAMAGTTFQELAAVAVCGGPGSYTGLRIGMATAKGLCYALDIPLMAHSRLALLAYDVYLNNRTDSQYVSVLLARVGEYFLSVYDRDFNCVVQPRHVLGGEMAEYINTAENTHIITDLPEEQFHWLKVNNLHLHINNKPRLESWAVYANNEYKCNSFVSLSTAEPFYLKQVYTHN